MIHICIVQQDYPKVILGTVEDIWSLQAKSVEIYSLLTDIFDSKILLKGCIQPTRHLVSQFHPFMSN